MKRIIERFYLYFLKKSGRVVVRNLGSNRFKKRALLHYKIDPVVDRSYQHKYFHTNNWEVPEIVRILNNFGFIVDVVDRSNRKWMPVDEYDLLISNASGNSGSVYPEYAKRTKNAKKIFYALGPEVSISNEYVLERYQCLSERINKKVPPMRVMNEVQIDRCMEVSDAIICLDDNGFSSGTYQKFKIPIYNISPSSSPNCQFNPIWINERKKNAFLCFTGDGFIAKGVDLLVEAFLARPDLELFIAGPNTDQVFWEIYGEKISKAKNIEYVGFVLVGGKTYNQLAKKCSYVILPPAAEGVCTSITTCMRSGLVPITTFESGVDILDSGYLLPSDPRTMIDNIIQIIGNVSNNDKNIYKDKVDKTINKAQTYSQTTFTTTFSNALTHCLKMT